MFVPPQTDPLAPEVHSLIFRQADLLGTNMSRRLEEAGRRGVGHNMIFDSYWPGGTRNTAWWKNVTGLLTEVASARIGTPIFIDPSELRGGLGSHHCSEVGGNSYNAIVSIPRASCRLPRM